MSDGTQIQWTDATWRRECSACRRALPREAFFVDRSRPGGVSFVCRECRNTKARARYIKKGRPGRRGWLVATRDGDKRQARRRVNYLVEKGLIPHPDALPCMDCADSVFTDRLRHEYDHARGYDGDNQLYVEPVCSRCHHAREEARHG